MKKTSRTLRNSVPISSRHLFSRRIETIAVGTRGKPAVASEQAGEAFTLVELLVVMAVIGLLSALLAPSLVRARDASRAAVCASNLRQLGCGAAFYALDNNERLPFFLNWLFTQPGDLTSGSLYEYIHNTGVYLCPTDKIALDSNAPMPPPRYRQSFPNSYYLRDHSYAMNCILCHNCNVSTFIAPSKTLLLMEPDLPRMEYTGMTGPPLSSLTHASSHRHKDQGHLFFSDFHVERLRPKAADVLQKSKIFWFPTTALTQTSLTNGVPNP